VKLSQVSAYLCNLVQGRWNHREHSQPTHSVVNLELEREVSQQLTMTCVEKEEPIQWKLFGSNYTSYSNYSRKFCNKQCRKTCLMNWF